jgi:hypothetical protein
MQLHDFQAALGRALCEPKRPAMRAGVLSLEERVQLTGLLSSAGFTFTRSIQRSWCEGRVALLARHTLAALPPAQRQALVRAWVDGGGGRNTFGAAEAIAFLAFVAGRLRDDPAALQLCRIEQAIHRASIGRQDFAPPTWPADGKALLARGYWATLVGAARKHGSDQAPLFFAPGLPGLFREATPPEQALWKQLAFARPAEVFADAEQIATLQTMYREGILAPAAAPRADTL